MVRLHQGGALSNIGIPKIEKKEAISIAGRLVFAAWLRGRVAQAD